MAGSRLGLKGSIGVPMNRENPTMLPSSFFRLLVSCALLPVALCAATVEERLAQLEARLATLTEQNTALQKQLEAATKKDSAAIVTAGGKVKKLSVGGYIQVNGETGDAADDRFPSSDRLLIRRARLTVKGSFTEDIDFTFQSEFGNGNLAANTNYRAQLSDLFVTWKKYEAANLTLGQFKTPYGYEQLIADTKNPFIERSLPNDRLTLSRQIGAMVSGKAPGGRVNYSAGFFNGNGVNNGANDNEDFLLVGRVSATALKSEKAELTVGTNAFTTDDGVGTAAIQRDGFGFDAQFTAGKFVSAIEWLRTDTDRLTAADTTAEGWSAYASYPLVANILRGAVRYETYDPNTSVSADDFSTWTVGLIYTLKGDDLKFSLNYLLGDPAGSTRNQGRLLGQAQIIF